MSSLITLSFENAPNISHVWDGVLGLEPSYMGALNC